MITVVYNEKLNDFLGYTFPIWITDEKITDEFRQIHHNRLFVTETDIIREDVDDMNYLKNCEDIKQNIKNIYWKLHSKILNPVNTIPSGPYHGLVLSKFGYWTDYNCNALSTYRFLSEILFEKLNFKVPILNFGVNIHISNTTGTNPAIEQWNSGCY